LNMSFYIFYNYIHLHNFETKSIAYIAYFYKYCLS